MATDSLPFPGFNLKAADEDFEWVDFSLLGARSLIPSGRYVEFVERCIQMLSEVGANGDVFVSVSRDGAPDDEEPVFQREFKCFMVAD